MSTGCCVTGLTGGEGNRILTMILAAGSRTMFCRTSSTWDCSTSTWRWVRDFESAARDACLRRTDRRPVPLSCFSFVFNVNRVFLLTQSFSLGSSPYSWPPARWPLSSLCSTTSWRSGSTPGSSPPSSGGRWQPRLGTSERGRKFSTRWPCCLWSPT